MDFEAYLISKKIDSAEFLKAEPDVWKSWRLEFDQMHPTSFTAQKLYLINPIRRKYLLKQELAKIVSTSPDKTPLEPGDSATASPEQQPAKTPASSKPVMPKPVFKPKPKTS